MSKYLMPVMVILIGLVVLSLGMVRTVNSLRLNHNPIEVISEPLSGYTSIQSTRSGSGTEARNEIDAPFKTQTGERFTCHDSIRTKALRQLLESHTIKLKYSPSNPEICRVEGSSRSEGYLELGLGLIATGAGIYLFLKKKKQIH